MSNIDEKFAEALRREGLERFEIPQQLPEETPLSPDAPAPRLRELVAELGSEPCAKGLQAWQARLNGASMVDVAAGLGLSIEAAKTLIKRVHEATVEDLKENLDLNRNLDLQRIDLLLKTYLPRAQSGKIKAAQLCLRALERRAKLTGVEPLPVPGRSHPQNVLIWLQAQLPSINRIVDSLPPELPPAP